MNEKHDVEITRGNDQSQPGSGKDVHYASPATDVFESAEAYLLLVDMPGAGKETISVVMHDDALIVRGVIGRYDEGQPGTLRSEVRTGGYYREFNVGDDVDQKNVEARYEQGVLTVKLFKKEETRPRQISIN